MKIWCPNRTEKWVRAPSKSAKWIRILVECEIDSRAYSHK